MYKDLFHSPRFLKLALLASLLSLAGALTAQYGFGLKPCHLCIAQRAPYAAVIALALLGMYMPRHGQLLLAVIAAAFLTGSGIAAYHAAVEKQLIAGPSGCTAQAGGPGESLEEFMKRIRGAPLVSCDQPQWEFHGVTLAGLNAVWSFGLAVLTFIALRQNRKEMHHA